MEASAAPDHDWNVRIARECYRPLAEAGAFDWMSFDFGPTLLRWMEANEASIHDEIVAADGRSAARLGFGNAVSQPYHHVILPLASALEKQTEVRWGIQDFERRFGRTPEGMWLPETAVDHETLEVMADAGIAFTVLSPHQVVEAPGDGRAGRVVLGAGREMAVFVYDGTLSHGVAFGELLGDADAWIRGLVEGNPERALQSIATDGETFGHHHRGAEKTLVEVLQSVERSSAARPDNFASALSRHGVGDDIELIVPSSWSCSHGVERWRADCGCKMAPHETSRQTWRAPLRAALRWLADRIDERLQRDGADSGGPLSPGLARDRGAMFTSCAWFFDDISGLEPTQVLRYAAHAIDTVFMDDPLAASELERGLVARLADAKGNDPEIPDAARLYLDTVRTEHPFPGTA